jgi:hypothetical protein
MMNHSIAEAAGAPLDAVSATLAAADALDAPDSAVASAPEHDGAIAKPVTTWKGRGRPAGLPRVAGSGRRRGTKNKFTVASRDEIVRLGDPVGLMCRVAAGHAVFAAVEPGSRIKVKLIPTLEQRLKAAELLLRKLLPDLKATEVSGPDGAPIAVAVEYSDQELARRVALMLGAVPVKTIDHTPRLAGPAPGSPAGLAGLMLDEDGCIDNGDGTWSVP